MPTQRRDKLKASAPARTPEETIVREATPAQIADLFRREKKCVVTFLGYSAQGYADPAAMLRQTRRVLSRLDPHRTLINIGATPEGIGAVYELAKSLGFVTTGIVSTRARQGGDMNQILSPWVDRVFFVQDPTWGGLLPGTQQLSPTSAAMVGSSDLLVAIGGGKVANAELHAARLAGKRVLRVRGRAALPRAHSG